MNILLRILLVQLISAIVLLDWTSSLVQAQGLEFRKAPNKAKLGTSPLGTTGPTAVVGKWTYRSFLSNPDLNVEPNDLLFGLATMNLMVTAPDDLSGTLGGPGWQLNLTGKVINGTPTSIQFTGKGTIGGEEWVYDYLGYAVPAWTNGVNQRPAIVGTIVRTAPHGTAPAGFVAQWIAVRQDAEPGALEHVSPAESERLRSSRKSNQQIRKSYLEEYPLPNVLDDRSLESTPRRQSRSSLGEDARSSDTIESRTSNAPQELRSEAGRLDVTLNVEYENVTIGRNEVRLRTYNGEPVGPTLRVKAGDTLNITLNNRLPVEPSTGHPTNGHHEWNTTNLHFHGLHVAPQGPSPDEESDNVLISIPPSDPFDPAISSKSYKVRIPADHVAGTFWYHAHRHGSTTAQVASGLAGALIVERDDSQLNLDSVPEVAACKQEIMVLQQVPYLKPTESPGFVEQLPRVTPDETNEGVMFSPGSFRDLKRYITVSGEKIPEIVLQPGEVKRLRIIHSGQRERLGLRVERARGTTAGPEFLSLHEIAVDGLPTGSIREVHPNRPQPRDKVLELFPGYRSDVLLKAPDVASEFYLVDTQNDSATTGPRPDTGADGSPELLRWVAKIVVRGNPLAMQLPLPTALAPHRLPDLQASMVSDTQYAFYGLELALDPIGYFISRQNLSNTLDPVSVSNAKPFDPLDDRNLPLGATSRWLIGSRNNGAAVPHPFHIHVNPFLITRVTSLVEPGSVGAPVDVTAREIGAPLWRDTLLMKHGYTYDLLTRYDTFSGEFVGHCHILDHEDNGMMEKIRILPTTPTPTPESPLAAAPTRESVRTRILNEIPKTEGKPSVLLFVQGAFCSHCLNQVTEMARHLPESRCRICVISASSTEDLTRFPNLPYSLVADPDKKLFKRFALEGNTHGTIVLDRSGKEKFRRTGSEPFMDLVAISRVLTESVVSVVIEVRETPEVTDDYITWAPTLCRARIVGGNPTEPNIAVVLTNDDPGSIPTGGDVRFASSLTPGETATALTQRLSLPQDGTAVSFYIAGAFGKPSTLTESSLAQGGRDAVIVVHRDSETGPTLGEHAVMVRVRKAMRRQDSNEPKLNDLELVELLKAMRALHFDQNRYEQYVFVHRLATGEGAVPDQAHLGPAFVAWHRAFLLQFERDLQAIAPHVSLPYWLQRERQDFYRSSRYGTNSGGTRVLFDRYSPSAATGSPLYGWTISLAHASPIHTGPMGPLERQNSDHNNPPSSATYQAWGPRLEGLTTFRDAFPNYWFQVEGGENQTNPNFNVERNPHNNGHVNVGPQLAWMEICTESNADPVFWVFHCNHDYLWARWQHYHNRFLTGRGNPDHYWPSDAFTDSTADQRTPRGHHLLDPMWPWDQSSSIEYPGERPNQRFPAFPASVVRGLWPAAAANPAPADVIDYQGIEDRGRDMGFCYDDVPWGHRSIITPEPDFQPLAAADDRAEATLFLSERVSTDQRLLAFQNADRQGSSITVERLAEVVVSPEENADIRRRSLQMLAGRANSQAIDVASKVLADAEAPLSLRIESLATINSLSHFSPLKHAQHMELQRQASSLLERSGTPPALRRQLLYTLAPSGDARAEEAIVSCLEQPEESPLTVPEAIRLLRFYPNQFDHVRKKLMSPNDESVVAAIEVLNHDKESIGARITVAVDQQRAEPVRKSALQSLMHDHSAEAIDALLSVFSAGEAGVDLRSEAIAAARINLELGRGFASKEQLVAWEKIVRNVETAGAGATELGSLKTDFLNQLSREAK